MHQVDLTVGAVVALTGQRPSPELVERAGATPSSLQLTEADAGEGLDPFAFYGASMAILFLFFTVGFAGYSVIAERRSGVLGRVQASGASPTEIITGKTAAVSVLAFSGFVVVWLATRLAFGARWGDPLGVVLVIAATVLALGGVATFVAALARTQQQADVYVSAVTFTFALLGGNFVGPDAPPLLDRLSRLTPNGWALSAFTDLSIGRGVTDVLVPMMVLVGFAVVFGAFGVLRLHRGFRL